MLLEAGCGAKAVVKGTVAESREIGGNFSEARSSVQQLYVALGTADGRRWHQTEISTPSPRIRALVFHSGLRWEKEEPACFLGSCPTLVHPHFLLRPGGLTPRPVGGAPLTCCPALPPSPSHQARQV